MELEFNKIVQSILSEMVSSPPPPPNDPIWKRRPDGSDPRAGSGEDPTAKIRSTERNAGLNSGIALKVTWARSGKQDFLRNPETKKPVVFGSESYAKWQVKADQLKRAGKITDFEFVDV